MFIMKYQRQYHIKGLFFAHGPEGFQSTIEWPHDLGFSRGYFMVEGHGPAYCSPYKLISKEEEEETGDSSPLQ
jgi:hypothetical protein